MKKDNYQDLKSIQDLEAPTGYRKLKADNTRLRQDIYELVVSPTSSKALEISAKWRQQFEAERLIFGKSVR